MDSDFGLIVAKREIGLTPAWFVIFSCVGGIFGFAGYIASSGYLETSVIPNVEPPIYTYGQQAILISLPISTVIGIMGGIAFALFIIGFRRSSVLAMLTVATLGAVGTYHLWYSSGIGECSSEIVLYYPIFGLCTLILSLGIILGAVAMVFPFRQPKSTSDTDEI
ncbi:MAG: hypothetical protein COA78_27670 [Blastopirellula sp.]|nr:MAG: hypothetical protein COA78_27670 [Blastopirellula sp.]